MIPPAYQTSTSAGTRLLWHLLSPHVPSCLHSIASLTDTVIPGGAAAKANVRANDVVEAVNGNPSPNYSGLIAVIGGVGRPVEIAFYRPGTSSDGGKPSGTGREPGPLQAAQDAARRKINRMTGPPQVGGNRDAAL